MNKIYRCKTYSVSNPNVVRVFISKSDDGVYYGSVLYHNRDYNSASSSLDIVYDFDKVDFLETEEEKVLQSCMDWIRENFEGDSEYKLIKQHEEQPS